MADLLGQALALVAPEAAAAEIALKALVSAMSSVVEKSDPAVIYGLGMAFDNLQAAIGQILAPVLQMLIPIIDDINVVINQFVEAFSPLEPAFKAIRDIITDVFGLLVDVVVSALAPIKTIMAGIMSFVNPIIAFFKLIFEIMKEGVHALLGIIGGTKANKSVAVQPSAVLGIEDIGKQFREAALAQMGGGDKDHISEIDTNVKEILDWLTGAKNIAKAVKAAARVVVSSETGITYGNINIAQIFE